MGLPGLGAEEAAVIAATIGITGSTHIVHGVHTTKRSLIGYMLWLTELPVRTATFANVVMKIEEHWRVAVSTFVVSTEFALAET